MFDSVYEFMRRVFMGNKCKTPVYDSMLKQLEDIQRCLREVKEELTFDKEVLLKELKKRDVIINAMIEELPDMLWFKDTDGKYLYANRAIRENLLFDDKPVGKTDVELALQAKAKFGCENHTFGEVCGNSDLDVLASKHVNRKYVESGMIRGMMTHLEVNKSTVELDGDIVGVVGSARDITSYREDIKANGGIDIFTKNEFTNKDT